MAENTTNDSIQSKSKSRQMSEQGENEKSTELSTNKGLLFLAGAILCFTVFYLGYSWIRKGLPAHPESILPFCMGVFFLLPFLLLGLFFSYKALVNLIWGIWFSGDN